MAATGRATMLILSGKARNHHKAGRNEAALRQRAALAGEEASVKKGHTE
jgi:hypothetical protein